MEGMGICVFPDECPRVWTSNAESPNEWCESVANIRHMTLDNRKKSCSAHGKAIYKRCLFAHVLAPLVEEADSNAFLDDLRAEGASKLAAESDSDSL